MFTYTAKNYRLDTGKRLVVPDGEALDILFKCPLKSKHCEGLKKNGARCGRNTVRALPYCWQHYQKINKIVISKSNVPNGGFGLFACESTVNGEPVFRKGDLICDYGGDILNGAQLSARYGSGGQTAVYAFGDPDSANFIDSACKRYIGAFANDSKGSKKRSNANIDSTFVKQNDRDRINKMRYRPLPPGKVIGLVATRNIFNGDEIYVNYGADYWKGLLPKYAVNASTKRVSTTSHRCRK